MRSNPLDYKISEMNLLGPAKGRLLIAEPFMIDSYFKRSVVLLVDHNESGSFGFILNKSLGFDLNEAINDFPHFESILFMGGPVESDHLFFIHNRNDVIQDSIEIHESIYWSGNTDLLKEAMQLGKIQSDEIRFFLGYSGWDSNQLGEEIKNDSWVISEPSSKLIFETPPEQLWQESLRKMGRDCSILANFPEDPTFN